MTDRLDAVDLLVVGAGPAGAGAVITARAGGASVVLADKATFPRDKTCGDGLTAEALRVLERLGLDLAPLPGLQVVSEVVLRSPSGRTVVLPMPGNGVFSAVVPRRVLDAALVDAAAAAGADIRTGAGVVGLEVFAGGGGVRARLADGSAVVAGAVVAADGVYSTVRKLLSPAERRPERYLGDWHAFRQYVDGVTDARQWVIFEKDLVPGYAWVFPMGGGRANVGFGVPRRAGHTTSAMAAQWRDLLGRPALREVLAGAVPAEPHRAWPIPADIDRAPLSVGPVLFAGDAAAATDPMTGEGIAQALVTGVLAAEAIVAGGTPDGVARRYRRSVEHHLATDLRFAGRLGRILAVPAGARAAIRVAGSSDWARRQFARWLFEGYPRAILLTPSRWRPGAFTEPGGYRHLSR